RPSPSPCVRRARTPTWWRGTPAPTGTWRARRWCSAGSGARSRPAGRPTVSSRRRGRQTVLSRRQGGGSRVVHPASVLLHDVGLASNPATAQCTAEVDEPRPTAVVGSGDSHFLPDCTKVNGG